MTEFPLHQMYPRCFQGVSKMSFLVTTASSIFLIECLSQAQDLWRPNTATSHGTKEVVDLNKERIPTCYVLLRPNEDQPLLAIAGIRQE